MNNLLKEKQQAFEALLAKKEKEFNRLKKFQEEQLESINDSQKLDSKDIIENPNENQMREVRIESKTLDKLKEQIEYLKGFSFQKAIERVGAGSLIKTNQGNFVVAAPEPVFEVKDKKFTGITTQSPLYQALEGKISGSKINFNEQELVIEAVA
jgi:hypothetical protein